MADEIRNSAEEFEEQERFVAFLDETMLPEQRISFQADLDRDPMLRARFETYQRTTQLLHGLSESDEAINLLPNLERRMGLRQRSSPALWWRLPLEVGGMLAVMLAAVIAFTVGVNSTDVVLPEAKPGPVEIRLEGPPSSDMILRYKLHVTEASLHSPPRVWTASLPRTSVQQLLEALGKAALQVTGYPANQCEPCAVFLFEPSSPAIPKP